MRDATDGLGEFITGDERGRRCDELLDGGKNARFGAEDVVVGEGDFVDEVSLRAEREATVRISSLNEGASAGDGDGADGAGVGLAGDFDRRIFDCKIGPRDRCSVRGFAE